MEKGENIQIDHYPLKTKAFKPFKASHKLVLGFSVPDN